MSGRRAAIPLAFWGLLLALTGTGLILWRGWDLVAIVLLPAAALTTFAIAAISLRAQDRGERRLPEGSASMPLLAFGITLAAVGAAVGTWAVVMGAWFALVAAVLLLAEVRA